MRPIRHGFSRLRNTNDTRYREEDATGEDLRPGLEGRLGSDLDFPSIPSILGMACPLRLQVPRAVYHLTAHGTVRQAIYLDNAERHAFLRLLGREVQQQHWHCYAYCLMRILLSSNIAPQWLSA